MVMTNRLVVYISAVCIAWVQLHMLLSAFDPYRSWYGQLGEWLLRDAKGGVPVINLAFPLLMAGSIASLCWRLPIRSREHYPGAIPSLRNLTLLPTWGHRWYHRLYNVEGDCNLDVWALSIILLPSVVFVAMTIYRHMHGNELSLDDQLLATSNAFGFVSELVGSILLIPVARHSPLLKVVGWSPARAVRLHIWAGRIFILAVVIHGGMHMFRWMELSKERLQTMIIPPASCWTWDDELYNSFQPGCSDDSTDCTCYAIFRNLTGFGAMVALLILLITSLHQIRRKFYRLFYLSHIVAAPLAILLVVLHWNKSILYMAPSLLYYAATSIPSFIERLLQSKSRAGVSVVAVEQIPSLPETKKEADSVVEVQYVSVTFEAEATAMQQFQPGYYVQLLAPEISSISHPFTVNAVPGKANQLRVIFKVLGKFTSDLSKQLLLAYTSRKQDIITTFPRLELNGYLGTPNRVAEVLRHDVSVMVAGGIGITPYLSLLHDVQRLLSQAPPNNNTYPTKRFVLIWICRDSNLVDYIKREYFQPLLDQHGSRTGFKIKLLVYHTGDLPSTCPSYTNYENTVVNTSRDADLQIRGVPFKPSRFAAGLNPNLKSNLLCFLSFAGISWMGLASVWRLYTWTRETEGVAIRAAGIVAILVVAVVGGFLINILAGHPFFRQASQEENESEPTLAPLFTGAKDECNGFSRCRSLGIEMEGLGSLSGASGDEYDPESNETNDSYRVMMEEKQGRPSVHEILNFVDNGRFPGLFTCGPLGLMQEIRDHTEERCLLRLQQCVHGASHHIALYEEAFSM